MVIPPSAFAGEKSANDAKAIVCILKLKRIPDLCRLNSHTVAMIDGGFQSSPHQRDPLGLV